MPKHRSKSDFSPFDHAALAARRCKPIPHEFVLDALAPISPWTRPMFGCLAVYVDEKIVLILRDKQRAPRTMVCGLPQPQSTTKACCANSPSCARLSCSGKR